ncbi:right-handed parallel beta-helix repeat-containing protein [Cohnella suwonensis]|uniref:Right-handed parallel beta-helix repeat-containing protein n=1 Tax=Cohnella suwonensis TaxID=696072 RepID=A0ABW0LU74_9BACL
MSVNYARENGRKTNFHPLFIAITLLLSSIFLNFGYPKSAYAAEAGIFFVSASGDDINPGTLDSPWRTIQKAADTLKPGETVYVRGGIYSELVSVKNSGTLDGGFITFQNYMNETPVIDGTGKTVEGVNQALVLLSNVNYVKIQGFEIGNLTSSSSSVDPAGIRVKNGGSNIQILNNNVHHIENTATSGNAHGIHVLGNSLNALNNLFISDNQVHHLKTGYSESITLSGNIDGFSVTRNQVYENNNIGIELAGYYNACSSPCIDQTRNGIVAENTVYRIDSSTNSAYGTGIHAAGGIYADGAANIVIERNVLYNNDFGIELASEKQGKSTSNMTVQNNYIHHNYGAGLIMGGASSSNGGASLNRIINNTFVENDTLNKGYGDITLQNNNLNNQFANNIIYNGSQKISINKINTSGSGNTFDYNLTYNPNGANGTQWKWDGVLYASWSAYKLGTGNDSHSLFGDPQFVDKSNNDIQLMSSSMGIDKGSSQFITSGSYDLGGSARVQGLSVDIGALEHAPVIMDNPQPSPEGSIGGNIDWSGIAVLSSGTSNAKILKAVKSDSNLNIYVEGINLTTKSQIFINSDDNQNTGFKTPYWGTAGADYLLENGTLYHYGAANGSKWIWTKVKSYSGTPNFSFSDTLLVTSIPYADLGTNQSSTLKIGYIWNDSNKNKLPASGGLAAVTEILIDQAPPVVEEPTHEPVPEPVPTPDPTPEPSPSPVAATITVDGDTADWSEVAILGSGESNAKLLKAYNNETQLYLLVQGSNLTLKSQFYINSDNNPATGFQSSNSDLSGTDYLIENGTLYRYGGTGASWSWTKVTVLKGTPNYFVGSNVIETAIPIVTLGVSSGSTIKIRFILNDNTADQVLDNGKVPVYTLK